MARQVWSGVVCGVVLSACASPGPEPKASPPVDPALAATYRPTSVGVATLQPDGAIVLQLRAGGPGGQVGDALIRMPPDDPRYAPIREHLGEMKVGESVPVRPWREP